MYDLRFNFGKCYADAQKLGHAYKIDKYARTAISETTRLYHSYNYMSSKLRQEKTFIKCRDIISLKALQYFFNFCNIRFAWIFAIPHIFFIGFSKKQFRCIADGIKNRTEYNYNKNSGMVLFIPSRCSYVIISIRR